MLVGRLGRLRNVNDILTTFEVGGGGASFEASSAQMTSMIRGPSLMTFLTVLFQYEVGLAQGRPCFLPPSPFPTRVRVMPRVISWHCSTRLTEKRLGGRGRGGPSSLIVGPSEVLIDRCQRSESLCLSLFCQHHLLCMHFIKDC